MLYHRLNEDVKPRVSTPSPTPFYPHRTLSPRSAACLEAILRTHSASSGIVAPPSPIRPASQATPSSTSTVLPSSAGTTPTTAPLATPPATPTKPSPKSPSKHLPKTNAISSKKPARTPTSSPKKAATPTKPPTPQAQKKNHVAKKVVQKLSLPSLLTKPSKVAKTSASGVVGVASSAVRKVSTKGLATSKNSVDKLKASKIIEQLRINSQHPPSSTSSSSSSLSSKSQLSGQFLTRLPPRTPYQALLLALSQASKPGKAPPPPYATPLPPPSAPSAQHTHSVFHDHFALLSSPHVPLEFSTPVTSLSLQLPLDLYQACVCARIARVEHSYAKASDEAVSRGEAGGMREEGESVAPPPAGAIDRLNLRLSVPRSLLGTNGGGCNEGCDKGALVICSRCQSLYHNTCTQSTLCTTCTTLQSLNLS